MAERLTLHTSDGLALEAERSAPPSGTPTIAAAVLCHPHPQFGGSMSAVVVSPLFTELPSAGIDCLRFNFRGVGESEGRYDEGRAEQLDAIAALEVQRAEVSQDVPLICAGFSFGADVALHVDTPAIDAWIAIAPPLHFGLADPAATITGPRGPTLVVLAQHDEFRAAPDAAALVGSWPQARVEVIGGASHFFVGRTDRLVEVVTQWCVALRA
jgi:alpha/beta superfamily hydrolase